MIPVKEVGVLPAEELAFCVRGEIEQPTDAQEWSNQLFDLDFSSECHRPQEQVSSQVCQANDSRVSSSGTLVSIE